MQIEAIVAMSDNRAIGNQGFLPWAKIPADMEHFRKTTMGQVIIMGRRTAESLPGPLFGRYLIGVSKTARRIPCTQEVADSYERAFVRAARQVNRSAAETVFVAGGESAYRWALDYGVLSAINLTIVRGEFAGDRFMPRFEDDFVELIEDKENADYAAYRKVPVGDSSDKWVTFRRYLVKSKADRQPGRNQDVRQPGAEQPRI
jgi:dihydrofolate reductase